MMTLAILFAAASPALALSSPAQPRYEARPGNQIFRVGSYVYDGVDTAEPVLVQQGTQFVDADTLLNDFISSHNLESSLPAARQWVAEEFYGDQAPTLGALRLKAGMTQGQLANITQQPQSSISRLESGTESPSIDRAKKLATVLGVTLDEFYEALNATRQGKENG